ncbi:MAG: cereblon family protein [Pseudomonadales bacterium]
MSTDPVETRNPVNKLLQLVEEAHRDPGDQLCCGDCMTAVTTANQKTSFQSTHNFHVTNPDGLEFDLACFSEAWGCGMHGLPSSNHSWFSGFRWQYARCLNCEAHLGWYFEEDLIGADQKQHFFGLIIDKLLPAT